MVGNKSTPEDPDGTYYYSRPKAKSEVVTGGRKVSSRQGSLNGRLLGGRATDQERSNVL